jgi:hypothetical protein
MSDSLSENSNGADVEAVFGFDWRQLGRTLAAIVVVYIFVVVSVLHVLFQIAVSKRTGVTDLSKWDLLADTIPPYCNCPCSNALQETILCYPLASISSTIQTCNAPRPPRAVPGTLRHIASGRMPELQLSRGHQYHAFLSSARDGAQEPAMRIGQELQRMLPGLRVCMGLLGVEVSTLAESSLTSSASCIAILSGGFFLSGKLLQQVG